MFIQTVDTGKSRLALIATIGKLACVLEAMNVQCTPGSISHATSLDFALERLYVRIMKQLVRVLQSLRPELLSTNLTLELALLLKVTPPVHSHRVDRGENACADITEVSALLVVLVRLHVLLEDDHIRDFPLTHGAGPFLKGLIVSTEHVLLYIVWTVVCKIAAHHFCRTGKRAFHVL